MANRRAPMVGKGSLLYEIYKDRLDPDTQVPDSWMSIRRAAAFAELNEYTVRRQVEAGLLPVRKRGKRVDINPKDVVKLNYDENGVRQIVKLENGERRPVRSKLLHAANPDLMDRAEIAIRYYPEWLEEVDEFMAYAWSKNSTTTPVGDGTPKSITNLYGDKTGLTARLIADMPKSLAIKARWVRAVYEVVYRQRRTINDQGDTARSYLELRYWGVNPSTLEDTALQMGIGVTAAKAYMKDIVARVALEAQKYNL